MRAAVPALELVEEGRFGSPLLLIIGAGAVVESGGHADCAEQMAGADRGTTTGRLGWQEITHG